MIDRRKLLPAAGWCVVATLVAALAVLLSAILTACSPAPEPGIVLYHQPSAQLAAQAHAKEAPGRYWAQRIEGVSMQPTIRAGDWMVADAEFSFESLKPGMICIYAPDWFPGLVIHLAAARSGDAWIMSGTNNAHYEGGGNGNGLHMERRHYRGRVLKVYSEKPAP